MMNCHSNIAYQRINESLSIRDVMAHHGVNAARGTRNILCPFHSEKTPSCKIYDDENRFYCFGCGAHGDIVDFVARRENVSTHDAIVMLNDEYGLGLDSDKPIFVDIKSIRAQRNEYYAVQRIAAWYDSVYKIMCETMQLLELWKKLFAPPDARAFAWMEYFDRINYLLDEMYIADDGEKAKLYRERDAINGIIRSIITAGNSGN